MKTSKDMQTLWAESTLTGVSAEFIEALYEDYLNNPQSVEPQWQEYFAQIANGQQSTNLMRHAEVKAAFRHLTKKPRVIDNSDITHYKKQVGVQNLIHAYRFGGHQKADFDPLSNRREINVSSLQLSQYALTESDLNTEFYTGDLYGPEKATLVQIIEELEQTYCGKVGSEFLHSTTMAERHWIQERLERYRCSPDYPEDLRKRLLRNVTAAEALERYLHSKYVGQKRFSLEGADGLIPMLDEVVQRSGKSGVKEVVIGMAHRGRLNVLVNVMGKTPCVLFQEFEGKHAHSQENTGDVKYHMGFSSNVQTPGGIVHIALAFNPSHLEIVGPVVEGSVRARQERRDDLDGKEVLPVIIHGDAAFAGQGVVMETFNMSQSRGYSTKGTLHIVINNQIGFTTSNQKDARSTMYCTDVAKMVNAPIFHVNGDDPEAICFVTRMALDYRLKFNKDVVIDLVCYRKHGHSEADEPLATQPVMYKNIKKKKTPREIYAQRLIDKGLVTADDVKHFQSQYRERLDAGETVLDDLISESVADYKFKHDWEPYLAKLCDIPYNTKVDLKVLQSHSEYLTEVPENFKLHFSVKKILDNRKKMLTGELPLDWGCAETLAYATLIKDDFHVRLSGQDSGRGTFFHRHAVVWDQETGKSYVPLRKIANDKSKFLVINSLLSEEAVLAFEYGYATTDPKTLTIWEAQFGDFANNAQVVIDQFISAGEQKWNRLCGLVMFLPHGFEGQGPEHSSARLERYLQLCAQNNMQVCVPTTPAQIFHLLRRQMVMNCRKPLIVMTPKSLLRHKLAVSDISDLTCGEFHPIIPEIDALDDDSVKRVVFCHGKVYYDLLEKRRELQLNHVAIIRMEQLYPFPEARMKKELKRYKNVEHYVWCQEEPQNQGSWFTSQHHVRTILPEHIHLEYAGRPFLAAPAVGHPALHAQQLTEMINKALGCTD